ncbi:hypothetical protein ONS95_012841 [Cadophora gregata]|uniref:uncharacterized protein n=1 Tax=Cadophora gregata TaxID=51156 RepID=UPI0026DBFC73|nr:uncharacterized protein ONS95_012841 [Cadophora gregata]KAK0101178.1 hypothetical protein ONS96_006400 [Cadophora gregata f. sp. sojae]KAK0115789.1 hypothetical protein ONS95_012841 [Cadophora gregata]
MPFTYTSQLGWILSRAGTIPATNPQRLAATSISKLDIRSAHLQHLITIEDEYPLADPSMKEWLAEIRTFRNFWTDDEELLLRLAGYEAPLATLARSELEGETSRPSPLLSSAVNRPPPPRPSAPSAKTDLAFRPRSEISPREASGPSSAAETPRLENGSSSLSAHTPSATWHTPAGRSSLSARNSSASWARSGTSARETYTPPPSAPRPPPKGPRSFSARSLANRPRPSGASISSARTPSASGPLPVGASLRRDSRVESALESSGSDRLIWRPRSSKQQLSATNQSATLQPSNDSRDRAHQPYTTSHQLSQDPTPQSVELLSGAYPSICGPKGSYFNQFRNNFPGLLLYYERRQPGGEVVVTVDISSSHSHDNSAIITIRDAALGGLRQYARDCANARHIDRITDYYDAHRSAFHPGPQRRKRPVEEDDIGQLMREECELRRANRDESSGNKRRRQDS